MAYFGIYIPPSKAGFVGNAAQCVGSIAALNYKPAPEDVTNASDKTDSTKYEDPEYPSDSPLWLIFTEKSKALDMLRHHKDGRLREFPNREQAESYVQFGFESIQALKRFGKSKTVSKPVLAPAVLNSATPTESPYSTSPTDAGSSPLATLAASSPLATNHASLTTNSNGNSGTTTNSTNNSREALPSLNAERPPFRAPSKQELVEFRKKIEAGNCKRVMEIVWENPRFLISSGDTPTSLKEGYRYNAMHICAQSNQARMADILLQTVSDPAFAQLYTGTKNQMWAAFSANLLDYYLNIPDKGRGETPLHFAAKNGFVRVVEVLILYPQCKQLPNKENQLPKDIICDRASKTHFVVQRQIELLLSNPFFVPLLRTPGNELPPKVGQPFTPSSPPNLQQNQQNNDESECLKPELIISALAGPMTNEQAEKFYRRWKTPPRLGNTLLSPLSNSLYVSPVKATAISMYNKSTSNQSPLMGRQLLFSPIPTPTMSDRPNGKHMPRIILFNGDGVVTDVDNESNSSPSKSRLEIETNNNDEQHTTCSKLQFDVSSTPICQAKSDFVGLSREKDSPSLRDDLFSNCKSELNLNTSSMSLNDSFRERHIKNTDIDKGLEVVGRQLAHKENLEWRENWDFLNAFIDISSPEGLSQFEIYLTEQKEQNWFCEKFHNCLNIVSPSSNISSLTTSSTLMTSAVTQVMTPYTCVEKSLQVFAKRITKTLINNIGNLVAINDTLLSELKRLKSLIISFKDDTRFVSVDFDKVHSRIAHLVASYIANSQEVSVAIKLQLLSMLRELLQLSGERREHLYCVGANMLDMLEKGPSVQLPEGLKTEELCAAAWAAEQCCVCQWNANLSRKTSRRKRTKSLRSVEAAISQNMAVVAPSSTTTASLNNENHSNSDEEDIFFDCYDPDDNAGSASSGDETGYHTPPESSSPVHWPVSVPSYDLFIFGNKPTKRDLQVLNAIVDIDIPKEQYPKVHAWRTAMESFSVSQKERFPSPLKPPTTNTTNTVNAPVVQPRRLTAPPHFNHVTPFRSPLKNSENWGFQTNNSVVSLPQPRFQTPKNKPKGTFSKYRSSQEEWSPFKNASCSVVSPGDE